MRWFGSSIFWTRSFSNPSNSLFICLSFVVGYPCLRLSYKDILVFFPCPLLSLFPLVDSILQRGYVCIRNNDKSGKDIYNLIHRLYGHFIASISRVRQDFILLLINFIGLFPFAIMAYTLIARRFSVCRHINSIIFANSLYCLFSYLIYI